MKIIAIKNIKYNDKYYEPGQEVEVKKEIAEELIQSEAAIAYKEESEEGVDS